MTPPSACSLEARDRNALLMLPLISGGETIGMMEVVDEIDREFDAADVDFCQALCNVVAPAVQNAMLYKEMKELAARDKLTGLYNRRLFEEQFDAAVARSQRNGEQLSLLVVDLDGLKRINDLGGHPSGDEALRALAESLVESSRAGDVACRLGGDEFAVILPGADTGRCDQGRGAGAGSTQPAGPVQLFGRCGSGRDQSRLVVRPLPLGGHRRVSREGRRRRPHVAGRRSPRRQLGA